EGKSRFPSKYALYEDGGLINVKAKDDNIRERDGFLEILGPPRKPKLGFDSYAGWLAYLMPGDLLFVKRFATYHDRVSNEGAVLAAEPAGTEAPHYSAELIFPLHAKHNHAPGVVECANRDLLASWYRGSGERTADDVAVYGSRLKKGAKEWEEPYLLADLPGF